MTQYSLYISTQGVGRFWTLQIQPCLLFKILNLIYEVWFIEIISLSSYLGSKEVLNVTVSTLFVIQNPQTNLYYKVWFIFIVSCSPFPRPVLRAACRALTKIKIKIWLLVFPYCCRYGKWSTLILELTFNWHNIIELSCVFLWGWHPCKLQPRVMAVGKFPPHSRVKKNRFPPLALPRSGG